MIKTEKFSDKGLICLSNAVKKIGVLTSGGDAPGMNAAIRAAVRTALSLGIEAVGIRRGYLGLLNEDMVTLSASDVTGLTPRGGTVLYTARCEEFKTPEGVKKGAENLRKAGIDGLVAIGGDGTFRGAHDLSKEGISVACIPATIDNDIACTSYTIGFDTACNTASEAIDRLRDTMKSHERCSIVEVMGHKAGHIALAVGIAGGATGILVPEKPYDMEKDVFCPIRLARQNGRTHMLFVVAEGAARVQDIADAVASETGIETRVTVLGHLQRGGSPLVHDRIVASRMGYTAVKLLASGERDMVVCLNGGSYCWRPISEAVSMRKGLDPEISVVLDALMAGC